MTRQTRASFDDTSALPRRFIFKPIDPLFRRDGAGTVLPIRIAGTSLPRDHAITDNSC